MLEGLHGYFRDVTGVLQQCDRDITVYFFPVSSTWYFPCSRPVVCQYVHCTFILCFLALSRYLPGILLVLFQYFPSTFPLLFQCFPGIFSVLIGNSLGTFHVHACYFSSPFPVLPRYFLCTFRKLSKYFPCICPLLSNYCCYAFPGNSPVLST